MKKSLILLFIIMTFTFIGCDKNDYSMNIIGEKNVLEGEQIKLEIETDLTDYIASWYSDDEAIATINEYGIVTGISEGKCKILLNIGKKMTSIDLTVKKFEVDIDFENTMVIGETKTLLVKYDSENEKNVFFASENENIATVDNYGNVTAISKGKTIIKIIISGIEKEVNVIVKNSDDTDLKPNPIVPLTVNVPNFIKYDELIMVSASRDVIWKSSDENILYVNEDNEIIIIDMGVVTLRATDANNPYVYVDTIITVSSGIAPTAIAIYNLDEKYEVRIGENYLPLLVKSLGDDKEIDMRVSWSVDNTDIAIIDERGVLTLKKIGKVVVKATSLLDSSIAATIIITITK